MNYTYTRAGLAACFSLVAASGLLAQRATVTSAADAGPGTLREIVTNSSAREIFFDAALDGTTISLASPITVTRTLDIRGNGDANTTITGTRGAFRVTAGRTQFFDLAIVNSVNARGGAIGAIDADVFVFDCRFEGNAGGGGSMQGGGALYGTGGTLYVEGSEFVRNRANEPVGSGGAILAGPGAELRVITSTFASNFAARAGGAIEDASGTAFVSDVDDNTFTENIAAFNPGNGGAIHVTGAGDIDITNTRAFGNRAREGGAFWNASGRMTVNDCVLRDNSATGPDPDQGGGAIFSEGGVLLVSGSGTQIVRNRASGLQGAGGGIFVNAGVQLDVFNGLIASNTATRAGGGIADRSGAATTTRIASVTFEGNGADIPRGDGGAYYAFGESPSEIHSSTFLNNGASGSGGAVYNGTGAMLVLGATFTRNDTRGTDVAQGGGAIYNAGGTVSVKNNSTFTANRSGGTGGSGGAIFNADGGTLDVANATFDRNSTTRAGGAIEDQSGSGLGVTISNGSFTGNYAVGAPGNGGAIHITGDGDIRIAGSDFSNNFASREGGALWNGTGTMQLLSVDVTANQAFGTDAAQGGGGLFNNGGTAVATGSTFADNRAPRGSGSGGAILNGTGGTLTIFGGSIADNFARRAGGGIEDASGSGTAVQLFDIDFTGNSTGPVPGNGGALHVTGDGDVTVKAGTVANNTAASEGGGLWNGTGVMTVGDVAFSGNVASGDDADNGGGAIFNLGGTLDVSGTTTFTGNLATGTSGSGGAILSQGPLRVDGISFTNNVASRAGGAIEDNSNTTVFIRNTTFTDNSAAAMPGNGGAVHVTGSATVTIQDSDFDDNFAAAEGGGFWNGTGVATITSSNFRRNTAEGDDADQGGGAIFSVGGRLVLSRVQALNNNALGASGSGGAVLFTNGATGLISESRFEGNLAMRAGGAIEHVSGAGVLVTVNTSDFVGNLTGNAPGNGGAIHVTGAGDTDINESTFTSNSADNEGGALWNGSGRMVVRLSDVSGNTVLGAGGGGGLFNNGGDLTVQRSLVAANSSTSSMAIGGGIHNANPGQLTVNYTTVSGNSSASNAGGIANAGFAQINGATIALNTAADNGGGIGMATGATQTILRSTIVAANTAPTRGANVDVAAGSYASRGFNAIGSDDAGVFPAAATDKEGSVGSPLVLNLQPLANNGGPTRTHAITCGSVAVNMGDPTLTREDQRNFTLNGRRDIGAFELQVGCPNPIVGTEPTTETFSVYPTNTRGNVTLELTSDGVAGKADNEVYVYQIVSARGEVVREVESASERFDVNVAGIPAGMYFIQRVSAAGVESHGFRML